MWDFLGTMLSMSWKVFGIMAGWMLIKHLMREGTGTLKELLETLGIAIRAGCLMLKKALWAKIKEEREPERVEPTGEQVHAEGTVK